MSPATTTAHQALRKVAHYLSRIGNETSLRTLATLSGVPVGVIPGVIRELKAEGSWPEGLTVQAVDGEGQ
jgi:hypothetical protein